MITHKLKCAKHPKYKGVVQPRCLCKACWAIFLGLSDAYRVFNEEFPTVT